MMTQNDLARRLNVSQQTVSLCFSRPSVVARETRQRVLKAANDLGYVPSGSARAMRRGKNNAIGLLLSTIEARSMVSPALLHSLRKTCRQSDLHIVMGDLPDEKLANREALPRILREWAVDGLLINYTYSIPEPMLEVIESHRMPSVWINTKLPGNCVYPDDFNAAREATEKLLTLGHRRIVYQAPAYDARHYSGFDRVAGYTAALKTAGLLPRVLRADTSVTRPERRDMFRSWLTGLERPTAILAYEPEDAGLYQLTATRIGLSVPDDLSIMTFHDGAACFGFAGTQFDTVAIPSNKLAATAIDMLKQRIVGDDQAFDPVVVPCELLAGETVGRVRDSG